MAEDNHDKCATKLELKRCKNSLEEDMQAHKTQLDELCAGMARVEAHVATTKDIVTAWNNTKNLIAGIGALSTFIKSTWPVWAICGAIWVFIKTGHVPTDWMRP